MHGRHNGTDWSRIQNWRPSLSSYTHFKKQLALCHCRETYGGAKQLSSLQAQTFYSKCVIWNLQYASWNSIINQNTLFIPSGNDWVLQSLHSSLTGSSRKGWVFYSSMEFGSARGVWFDQNVLIEVMSSMDNVTYHNHAYFHSIKWIVFIKWPHGRTCLTSIFDK